MKHRAEVNRDLLSPGDRVLLKGLKPVVRLVQRLHRNRFGNMRWAGALLGTGRTLIFSSADVRRVVSYIEQTGW